MQNVFVDVDLEAMTLELLQAVTAPGVRRVADSGATALAVEEAASRLAEIAERGLSRVFCAARLLVEWRARLDSIGGQLEDRDASRGAWLGVAGASRREHAKLLL